MRWLLHQDNIGLGKEHVVVQVMHQEEGQHDDVVTLVKRQCQGLTEQEQDQGLGC